MFFSVLFCTVRLSIFERFVFASFEPFRFCKKVRFVFPDLNTFGQDASRRGVDIYSYPASRTFSLGVKVTL